LSVDEFEAIRLKDLEGLEQTAAADSMRISQPTFHRVIEAARKKVADALVNGKAIRIEGGEYTSDTSKKFKCLDCGNEWDEPHGKGRPEACPKCGSKNIHRALQGRGYARLGRGHRGHFEI
jgi:DNA-directed RNA polymerase subunit RPC12/RpoP